MRCSSLVLSACIALALSFSANAIVLDKRLPSGPVTGALHRAQPDTDLLPRDDIFNVFEKRRIAGCVRDAQCTTTKPNAFPVCNARRCTFQCNAGFYFSDGGCRVAPTSCGTESCGTLANGYYVCINTDAGPTCSAQCARAAGYRLYQNGGQSVCVKTANDANNCGGLGVTCSSGYGGGVGICVNSACTLSCPGGTTLSSRNGALACLATARRRY